MDTVFVTLSLTINETFKWPSSLPVLTRESFCLVSDSAALDIVALFPHLLGCQPSPRQYVSGVNSA